MPALAVTLQKAERTFAVASRWGCRLGSLLQKAEAVKPLSRSLQLRGAGDAVSCSYAAVSSLCMGRSLQLREAGYAGFCSYAAVRSL